MYGQKQIFQCLGVVVLVSVLNFYRAAIRRNKEMQQYKQRHVPQLKTTPNTSIQNETAPLADQNVGYCLKNPFGDDLSSECGLCGWFENWSKKQCKSADYPNKKKTLKFKAKKLKEYNGHGSDYYSFDGGVEVHENKMCNEEICWIASRRIQRTYVCSNETVVPFIDVAEDETSREKKNADPI